MAREKSIVTFLKQSALDEEGKEHIRERHISKTLFPGKSKFIIEEEEIWDSIQGAIYQAVKEEKVDAVFTDESQNLATVVVRKVFEKDIGNNFYNDMKMDRSMAVIIRYHKVITTYHVDINRFHDGSLRPEFKYGNEEEEEEEAEAEDDDDDEEEENEAKEEVYMLSTEPENWEDEI